MTLLSESRDALHSLLLNCRTGELVSERQEAEVMALIMRLDEAADVERDDMAPIYEISGEANGE